MTDEPEIVDARDAWREALARAAGYVEAEGGPLQGLRARALLGHEPGKALLDALAAEGALAADDPDALCRAFAMADAVTPLAGPDVEAAIVRLTGRLGPDGSFGDGEEALETRIVRTGLLGGFLAKSLRMRPSVRDAIDRFLSGTWDADRVKTGESEPIAAYAHWFSLVDSELSDPALQWCGRELERGFRTRRFDAVTTARVFVLCDASALPGASLSVPELCEALANEQTGEGGWALSARALAGEPVEAALDGMAALVRIGRLGRLEGAGAPWAR